MRPEDIALANLDGILIRVAIIARFNVLVHQLSRLGAEVAAARSSGMPPGFAHDGLAVQVGTPGT